MWFFTKKIGKIVEEKFKDSLVQYETELRNEVSETREKIGNIKGELEVMETNYLKLRRKTFKAQGIEKIIFHPDYLKEDKARLVNIAKTQFNAISYQFSRFSFPIKISKKTTYFRVNSNCAIAIKGLKFMDGDGWGRYQINKGTEPQREFAKSRLIQEDGILMNIYYYPDDVVSINQIQGDGEIQIELLGGALIPFGLRYPLTEDRDLTEPDSSLSLGVDPRLYPQKCLSEPPIISQKPPPPR